MATLKTDVWRNAFSSDVRRVLPIGYTYAQACLDAATRIERPIMNCTVKSIVIRPMAPDLPMAS